MILSGLSETTFALLSLNNKIAPLATNQKLKPPSVNQSPRKSAISDISVQVYLAGLSFFPSRFQIASLPKANIDVRLQHLAAFFDDIYLSGENEHVFSITVARPRCFDKYTALQKWFSSGALHGLFAESYQYWLSNCTEDDDWHFIKSEKIHFTGISPNQTGVSLPEDPILRFVQKFQGKDIVYLPICLPMDTIGSNQFLEAFCQAGYRLLFVGGHNESNDLCVIRWIGFDYIAPPQNHSL